MKNIVKIIAMGSLSLLLIISFYLFQDRGDAYYLISEYRYAYLWFSMLGFHILMISLTIYIIVKAIIDQRMEG